jgi:hypothetical protein
MTTQAKQPIEMDVEVPVGKRTDKELQNRRNAIDRAVGTRKDRKNTIDDEIKVLDAEHDAIVDEQTRRLQAKRTRPVEAAVDEKEGGE